MNLLFHILHTFPIFFYIGPMPRTDVTTKEPYKGSNAFNGVNFIYHNFYQSNPNLGPGTWTRNEFIGFEKDTTWARKEIWLQELWGKSCLKDMQCSTISYCGTSKSLSISARFQCRPYWGYLSLIFIAIVIAWLVIIRGCVYCCCPKVENHKRQSHTAAKRELANTRKINYIYNMEAQELARDAGYDVTDLGFNISDSGYCSTPISRNLTGL